jgi:hypothetical protein
MLAPGWYEKLFKKSNIKYLYQLVFSKVDTWPTTCCYCQFLSCFFFPGKKMLLIHVRGRVGSEL